MAEQQQRADLGQANKNKTRVSQSKNNMQVMEAMVTKPNFWLDNGKPF
jgi:hypothetical protein